MSMSDPLNQFISFRFSRDFLFPKPVTGQYLFFAISYNKLILVIEVMQPCIIRKILQ